MTVLPKDYDGSFINRGKQRLKAVIRFMNIKK